ncbi:response regulator transcription factor [Echinimonas agarilytica]|uniref:Phosphate regulon transcriptional regulatory protein PhoB n=1 Tax=Echinimonas agarilytica TaxID=1215918 RepID=A0AA42B7F0_9GAMM|nr:response regulator transcription factor [Echinimonas agarilytica]MCM2679885.1 response regulator transcription factor [Echinimonas agarilytica]
MSSRILVIEDDQDINQLISMNLSDMQHHVDTCEHGEQGLQRATCEPYDLIVLDLMLPGIDGLEICRRLRAEQDATPILMVTARDSELDRVIGLEMGADDYLTKPFSIRELQARVKAMLRRMEMMTQARSEPQESVIQHGALSIDVARRRVTLHQQFVELTSTEFDLLLHMARAPGLVFSRSQLLDQVWGYKHSGYEHTVNSHINRLRTKLEQDPSKPEYVLTVWGVGYKFSDA